MDGTFQGIFFGIFIVYFGQACLTAIDEDERDKYLRMGVPPLVASCEADYDYTYYDVCKEAIKEFYGKGQDEDQ